MIISHRVVSILCAATLSCFSMAERAKESTPPPANLLSQLSAMKDRLALSNATENTTLRKDDRPACLQMVKETERLVNSQQYEEALQRFRSMPDHFRTLHGEEFQEPLRNIQNQLTELVAQKKEALLLEGKKLEEEGTVLFPAAKTPEEMTLFRTKVEDFRARLPSQSSFFSGSGGSSEHMSKFRTLSAMAMEWSRVLASLQSGDFSKASAALQNFKSSYGSSELMNTSAMQKRMSNIEGQQENCLATALANAKEKCIKAETSEALDTALDEWNTVTTKNQTMFYNNRTLQTKAERLQQGAKQWLRVLVAVENENYNEALQHLSSMESDSYTSSSLFSRKELAAKKSELLKKSLKSSAKESNPVVLMIDEMMSKVKTIEDLGPVKQALQRVSNFNYSQSELQNLLSDIQALEQLQEIVKSGNFALVLQTYSYRSSEGYRHKWRSLLEQFRATLRQKFIGELCGIKDFTVGKNETPEKVLQSYIDKAATAGDWELALKYLDAYRLVFAASGNYPSWLADEITAIRQFLAARNFERAEEYERALLNYMSVLNSTSKRLPIDDTIDAIKKIKKNHPDAYEKASKSVLPSPASSLPLSEGYRVYRPGY